MKKTIRFLALVLAFALAAALLPQTALPAKAAESWNVWVAGLDVTTDNQDDVLGDGTVSYDPTSKTLTLKDAMISDALSGAHEYPEAAILAKQDLTITGTGTVGGMYAGIIVYGDLTIRDASLEIGSFEGPGITVSKNAAQNAQGKVLIENSKISVDVIERALQVMDSDLLIRNSRLTLEGDDGGLFAKKGLTLQGRNTFLRAYSYKVGAVWAGDGISLDSALAIEDGRLSADRTTVLDNSSGSDAHFVVISGTRPSNPFEDVEEDAYYYEPVLWAVSQTPAITAGTDATHFSPAKECTRAQVVTFLWNAAGQPEPGISSHPFTDVKEGAYYYKAMLWALENDITAGTSATTFGPNAQCTRGQVVRFLWNAAGAPAPDDDSHPFTDVKEGAYYYDAMLWAVNHTPQITAGSTATTFAPAKPCTRGQVVSFLYRAIK